jgi:hypothetical protein
MKRFLNWLTNRTASEEKTDQNSRYLAALRGSRVRTTRTVEKPLDIGRFNHGDGHADDRSPGKNTLPRKKYVREDTGTHETLTIIDESLLGADDADGIDPYNSGRFDRAGSWNNSRSRK